MGSILYISGTKKTLVDIIEDEKCYYKVRCAACHALTKVSNSMAAGLSEGPPALLVIFKKMFVVLSLAEILWQPSATNNKTFDSHNLLPVQCAQHWPKEISPDFCDDRRNRSSRSPDSTNSQKNGRKGLVMTRAKMIVQNY